MNLLLYGVILMGCIHAYRRLEDVRCIRDGYTKGPSKENDGHGDRKMQRENDRSKREERKREKTIEDEYNDMEVWIDVSNRI